MGNFDQATRSQEKIKIPPSKLQIMLRANIFKNACSLNEAKTWLKRDAKPTLFNIPNAPAKVGLKRRIINREPETQFQGNSNEILLLDDVLVFHRAKENSFINYLHNF